MKVSGPRSSANLRTPSLYIGLSISIYLRNIDKRGIVNSKKLEHLKPIAILSLKISEDIRA